MNELMINMTGTNWIYFKTQATTAKAGFADFETKCQSIGIDISNLDIESIVLRNEHGEEELEKIYIKKQIHKITLKQRKIS